MLSSKLHSSIGNTDQLYVDDVFSAYTYTGNGSTQTINNGIDLAGEGGMVWIKQRQVDILSNSGSNNIIDTARGGDNLLETNNSNGNNNSTTSGITFNSNGFSLKAYDPNNYTNRQAPYASWTFRKAPKFFDVVTYTGNGASSRAIAHLLGQEVGMVMTKATSTAGDWNTYHRSATGDLVLNGNNAQTGSKALVNSATTSTFTVSGAANTNAVTYVAYLFAHDTSAAGIIQCGSFTGSVDVNLGWEAQYVLMKDAGGTGNWYVLDTMRGMSYSQGQALSSNTSGVESAVGSWIIPTATGFRNVDGGNYIYLAIRRPNKPPTTGTQVYNAIARTGTDSVTAVSGVGFAPDLAITHERPYSYEDGVYFSDKLRGFPRLTLNSINASAEYNPAVSASWGMDGFNLPLGSLNRPTPYVHHFFKRAPGFFDVVCYTGTGSNRTVNHSLGVAPELIIIKSRSATGHWLVYATVTGLGRLFLNLTQALDTAYTDTWNAAHPTNTVFSIGLGGYGVNNNNVTYVAYLFASLPGISKVGSYTGNGSSQTINCGFSTGARFVLIKCTNSAGDWFVWDTVRGIVSANDPHLSLNTSAAEATTNDSVDPESTGFIVNQDTATNINVTSATYIFLAVS